MDSHQPYQTNAFLINSAIGCQFSFLAANADNRLILQRTDEKDTEEFNRCELKWDCENCDKTLCLRIVALADFPTRHGHFNVVGFLNNKDKKDHIMVVKGNVVHGENILTRLHSSCVTGDALESMRCDCGPQLAKSLTMIEREGLGALLSPQCPVRLVRI